MKEQGIGKNRYMQGFPQWNSSSPALTERKDKWDYMKFKSFCTTKEMDLKLK
jgi:hypothetical protein